MYALVLRQGEEAGILDMAAMELFFPRAALLVLFFGLVVGKVLAATLKFWLLLSSTSTGLMLSPQHSAPHP